MTYSKEWYQKNRDKIREKNKAWRDANKEKVKEINRRAYLKRKGVQELVEGPKEEVQNA